MILGFFKISGHSMEPAIKNGSVVIASSVPFMFKKPKLNDVAAFKNEEKIFVKRISKINGNKYLFFGDNKKDSLDSRKIGLVNRESIVGKVLCIIS